jgi:hypothetical protein
VARADDRAILDLPFGERACAMRARVIKGNQSCVRTDDGDLDPIDRHDHGLTGPRCRSLLLPHA